MIASAISLAALLALGNALADLRPDPRPDETLPLGSLAAATDVPLADVSAILLAAGGKLGEKYLAGKAGGPYGIGSRKKKK